MKILIPCALPEDHLYSQSAVALQAAFQDIGHACDLWRRPFYGASPDAMQAVLAELLGVLQAGGYEGLLSFGALLGDATLPDGSSLFDAIGVKFLGWGFDHPVDLPGLLSPALRQRYSIYSNENHRRFVEELGIPGRSAVLLPGAVPSPVPAPSHDERRWPIVVAAAYRGPPPPTPWAHWPDVPQKRLLDKVTDHLLASPEASVVDVWAEIFGREGMSLSDIRSMDPGLEIFRGPLTHVRNLDRFNLVRALAESGLPVVICGSGWREAFGDRANVTYLETIPFAGIAGLYDQARICINLNAGNGASERAVQAALSGAAVVSDYSAALEDLLGAGRGVVFYRRADPASLVRAAGELLESHRSQAVGEAARQRVLQSGTWRRRAEQAALLLTAG